MPETGGYIIIAHLRPKPGAEERLLSIRHHLIDEFRSALPGFVSATLCRVDDSDEWRDVVVFTDRAAADFTNVEMPTYPEWASLVDVVTDEFLEPIAQHKQEER